MQKPLSLSRSLPLATLACLLVVVLLLASPATTIITASAYLTIYQSAGCTGAYADMPLGTCVSQADAIFSCDSAGSNFKLKMQVYQDDTCSNLLGGADSPAFQSGDCVTWTISTSTLYFKTDCDGGNAGKSSSDLSVVMIGGIAGGVILLILVILIVYSYRVHGTVCLPCARRACGCCGKQQDEDGERFLNMQQTRNSNRNTSNI